MKVIIAKHAMNSNLTNFQLENKRVLDNYCA